MQHTRRPWIVLLTVVWVAGWAAGCGGGEEAGPEPQPSMETAPEPEPEPATASADFTSLDGAIQGSASFTQREDGVEIHVLVDGAPAGTHGFHIHETGDCSADDFTSAGGHFNPSGVPHGGPGDAERHAGDLGNIDIAENGTGHLELTSDLVTIDDGANAVVGRAVILHADADDLVSQPTGAAGARLACGVIQAGG